MSFSRANPSGWATNDVITPAQLNAMDVNISNAVDGAAGGTYAPDYQWDGTHVWTTNPKLQGSSTWIDFDAARTIWRRVPLDAFYTSGTVDKQPHYVRFQTSGALASFDLTPCLPEGALVVGVRASIKPGDASPTQNYSLGVQRIDGFSTIVDLGTTVDPATGTTYSNDHSLEHDLSAPDPAFSADGGGGTGVMSTYLAIVTAETDATFANGYLFALAVGFQMTELRI